ncbi:hypothetical protein C7475_11284 [Chitinophaga sp. S165]|nr:hypothetical protein C7475_11284 [Chitinophaga sp. S165]
MSVFTDREGQQKYACYISPNEGIFTKHLSPDPLTEKDYTNMQRKKNQ